MRRAHVSIPFLVAAALSRPAFALDGAEKTLTVERAMKRGGAVIVENLLGSVRIASATDRGPLRIEAHVAAEAKTVEEARALVESIRIEQRTEGDAALFHVVFPVEAHSAFRPPRPGVKGLIARWTAPMLRGSSTVEYDGRTVEVGPDRKAAGLAVNLEITLPYDLKTTVRQSVGSIEGRALRGTLSLVTGDADITVERSFGSLHAETQRGLVRILHFQGDALDVRNQTGGTELLEVRTTRTTLRSTAGPIRGSSVSTEALDVESAEGDVRVADLEPAEVRIETGSGAIDVSSHWTKLKQASLHSAAGDVTLRVGDLTHFDLTARSRTGTVKAMAVTLALVEQGGPAVHMRHGQGGADVNVEAPGGEVVVRPYDASRMDLLVRER